MDLSKLSDDQLRALYGQSNGSALGSNAPGLGTNAPGLGSNGSSLASMSDDDLKRMYAQVQHPDSTGSQVQDIVNDAKDNAAGFYNAIRHPIDTAGQMFNTFAMGPASKLMRSTGATDAIVNAKDAGQPEVASLDRDIEAQKAKMRERSTDAVLNKFGEDLSDPVYTLTLKPVSALMDISTLAAPMASLPGKVGEVAGIVSNATNVPGMAINGATRVLRPVGEYAATAAKVDPQVILGRQAVAREFGVPLTQGQQSGSAPLLSAEDNLRYSRGGQAQNVMQGFDAQQDAAIANASDGLRSGMTGSPFAMTPGEIGDAMGTAYQNARQAAKTRVTGLYDRAFDPEDLAAHGIADHVPIETVYGLANNIENAFAYPERGAPLIPTKENAPNTTAAIDRLRQFSDTGGFPSAFNKFTKPGPDGTPVGISWQGIDTMRRTLDGLRRASVSNPYDAMAMRRLMDVFDEQIGKTNPLLNEARAAHAERVSTFEPQRTNAQGVNTVLSAISNDANPGNLIYNKLFGNNSISNGTAAPVLDQLGSIMMSSPQAMSALREGMLNRIFQNEKTGAAHSPKIAANNIRDALNGQGAGIYQSVFDPVQLAKLQRYGDLLDHIGTTRPAINASKTSYNVNPGVRNGTAGMAGALVGEHAGSMTGIPYAGPVLGYAGMKLGSAVDNAANNVLAHARAQKAVTGTYAPSSLPPQVAGNVATAINALNAASPAARRIGLLALLQQQSQR